VQLSLKGDEEHLIFSWWAVDSGERKKAKSVFTGAPTSSVLLQSLPARKLLRFSWCKHRGNIKLDTSLYHMWVLSCLTVLNLPESTCCRAYSLLLALHERSRSQPLVTSYVRRANVVLAMMCNCLSAAPRSNHSIRVTWPCRWSSPLHLQCTVVLHAAIEVLDSLRVRGFHPAIHYVCLSGTDAGTLGRAAAPTGHAQAPHNQNCSDEVQNRCGTVN
jgi:hypothetical protein